MSSSLLAIHEWTPCENKKTFSSLSFVSLFLSFYVSITCPPFLKIDFFSSSSSFSSLSQSAAIFSRPTATTKQQNLSINDGLPLPIHFARLAAKYFTRVCVFLFLSIFQCFFPNQFVFCNLPPFFSVYCCRGVWKGGSNLETIHSKLYIIIHLS